MSLSPLRDFVIAATRLLSQTAEEAAWLAAPAAKLAEWVARGDWLPNLWDRSKATGPGLV